MRTRAAGKFNRLITLSTAAETVDTSSALQRGLTLQGQVWAAMKGVRGDKQLIAAAEVSHAIVDWTIGLPISIVLNTQTVITYQGEEYEVVDLDESQNFDSVTMRTRLRRAK